MILEVDSHAHTVASGHAFHTLEEMAAAARKAGLKGFSMTDHAPYLLGSPPWYYFNVLLSLPEEIQGVRVYKGIEANILGESGRVDMKYGILKQMDIVLGSLHVDVITPLSRAQNTRALCGALENPLIDMIGHPGNPQFPVDVASVVHCAAEHKKLIEINEHSFVFRKGSTPVCRNYIQECKRQRVRICINSDAHSAYNLGRTPKAIQVVEEEAFPEELIVNLTRERFDAYVEERRRRIAASQTAPED